MKSSLRADAKENKDRLLEIARKSLASDPQASLNSIARTAGVGPGTLYRHFPNRESLIIGVYRKEIDELTALAPTLLIKHPPLKAFRLWCDRLAQFGRMKHGAADIIDAAKSNIDFQETYGPMLAAVGQLMDACERSGDIHPAPNPEDFLLLVSFLWKFPQDAVGEKRVKRLLALVFRGLGVKE